jgi:hypothetical protein
MGIGENHTSTGDAIQSRCWYLALWIESTNISVAEVVRQNNDDVGMSSMLILSRLGTLAARDCYN